jgi:hypothetical protein
MFTFFLEKKSNKKFKAAKQWLKITAVSLKSANSRQGFNFRAHLRAQTVPIF